MSHHRSQQKSLDQTEFSVDQTLQQYLEIRNDEKLGLRSMQITAIVKLAILIKILNSYIQRRQRCLQFLFFQAFQVNMPNVKPTINKEPTFSLLHGITIIQQLLGRKIFFQLAQGFVQMQNTTSNKIKLFVIDVQTPKNRRESLGSLGSLGSFRSYGIQNGHKNQQQNGYNKDHKLSLNLIRRVVVSKLHQAFTIIKHLEPEQELSNGFTNRERVAIKFAAANLLVNILQRKVFNIQGQFLIIYSLFHQQSQLQELRDQHQEELAQNDNILTKLNAANIIFYVVENQQRQCFYRIGEYTGFLQKQLEPIQLATQSIFGILERAFKRHFDLLKFRGSLEVSDIILSDLKERQNEYLQFQVKQLIGEPALSDNHNTVYLSGHHRTQQSKHMVGGESNALDFQQLRLNRQGPYLIFCNQCNGYKSVQLMPNDKRSKILLNAVKKHIKHNERIEKALMLTPAVSEDHFELSKKIQIQDKKPLYFAMIGVILAVVLYFVIRICEYF